MFFKKAPRMLQSKEHGILFVLRRKNRKIPENQGKNALIPLVRHTYYLKNENIC